MDTQFLLQFIEKVSFPEQPITFLLCIAYLELYFFKIHTYIYIYNINIYSYKTYITYFFKFIFKVVSVPSMEPKRLSMRLRLELRWKVQGALALI